MGDGDGFFGLGPYHTACGYLSTLNRSKPMAPEMELQTTIEVPVCFHLVLYF